MTNQSHTEKDVAEIAGLLSADQVERIVEAECCSPERHPFCICSRDFDDLIDLGLAGVSRRGSGIIRTALGLAVRNHLISTPDMPKGDES